MSTTIPAVTRRSAPRRSTASAWLLAAVAAVGVPAAGSAQARSTAPAPTVRQGSWMLSVNPFGLIAGGLTGEAERKFGGSRTLAGAVNYWGYGGASYLSMDAKLRFYHRTASGKTTVAFTNSPATDFEALSFGPMVGFQRISVDACAGLLIKCSATGLTAGGTVDYGWRLGKEKQFSAVAGAGIKTGFGLGDIAYARATYPFIRLGVGYVLAGGK